MVPPEVRHFSWSFEPDSKLKISNARSKFLNDVNDYLPTKFYFQFGRNNFTKVSG
jgi:hypothetical protein